jgi:ABC-type dipeptide/oligopeptide/nickel transport system permease component
VKLLGFLAKRLGAGAVTVLVVATLCFAMLHAIPGDPCDFALGETATAADHQRCRSDLHLDRSWWSQYGLFLGDMVFRGMGKSFTQRDHSAWHLIADVWPDTATLALSAALVAWVLAIPLALLAATRPNTRTDAAVGVFSLAGMALPSLWTGPILISLFCVTFPVLPFPGPDAGGVASLVLPSITLGAGMAGILTRMARASLREVLREPYVTAARARGLSELAVVTKHALRSALVPLMTVGGAQLTALLGGAVITEKIFDRRGLGSLFLESLQRRDLPVALGCVVVVACTVVLIQLVVDLAYAVVDPRIRVE